MKTTRLFTLSLFISFLFVTSISAQYDYLGLVGNACITDWNPNGEPMLQDVNNAKIFTYRGPLKAGELKIHTVAGDWGVGDWIMPGTANQSISLSTYIISQGDPDNKWLISQAEAGIYLITVDLENATILFERQRDYDELFLIGSATEADWDINNGVSMTMSAEDENQFVWAGPLKEGEFKIGTVRSWNDGWDFIMPVTNGQDLSLTNYKIDQNGSGVDDKWLISSEQAGNYKISVDLTAETILIEAVEGDATLSGITLSTGTLSPAFDAGTLDYFVTVEAGTTSVDVGATATDANATVEGTGDVDVSSGSGVATIKVTADDGITTAVYTVTIDVGASTDATLSGLTVSVGALDPSFNPTILSYDLIVPQGTTSVDVSATENSDAASVTGAGTVDVSSGSGTATITVLAEDGETTNTYTVNITVFVPSYYDNLYLIGPATSVGWDIANPDPMTVDPQNEAVFTWEDTLLVGQFKIVAFSGDWCQGDELVPTADNQVLTATDYEINSNCTGNDRKWLVDVAGVYNVKVDLENETITITLVNAIDLEYDNVHLVGDATPSGWDIQNPVAMDKDPTKDQYFTWTGTLTAGELKFSTFTGDWGDGDWILATQADQVLSATDYKILNGNVPAEDDMKWRVTADDAGTYTITLDLDAETVVFEKSTVGVVNSTAGTMNVYPNPASSQIFIEMEDDQLWKSVSVITLSGQELFVQRTIEPLIKIDLDQLNIDGMVIVQIISGQSASSKLLIVK